MNDIERKRMEKLFNRDYDKNKYEIYRIYENNDKEEYFCYDISEKFAYFCPFKLENNDIILDIKRTIVYSLAEGNGSVDNIVLPNFYVEEEK